MKLKLRIPSGFSCVRNGRIENGDFYFNDLEAEWSPVEKWEIGTIINEKIIIRMKDSVISNAFKIPKGFIECTGSLRDGDFMADPEALKWVQYIANDNSGYKECGGKYCVIRPKVGKNER